MLRLQHSATNSILKIRELCASEERDFHAEFIAIPCAVILMQSEEFGFC